MAAKPTPTPDPDPALDPITPPDPDPISPEQPETPPKKPLFIGLCEKCQESILTNLDGEVFCPLSAPDCPRGI